MDANLVATRKRLEKELRKYPHMKFWLMQDLRKEHLEYAIAEREEYDEVADEVDDFQVLDDLAECGGPKGYLYRVVREFNTDRDVTTPGIGQLVDVAKDFDLTTMQLAVIYDNFPKPEQWLEGDLHEMYRAITKDKDSVTISNGSISTTLRLKRTPGAKRQVRK